MKTLIIAGTYVVLFFGMLTSCKKSETSSETISETGTHIPSSPVPPSQRFLETNDTEDRPKMVKGHIQNSSQTAVPDASVVLFRSSDSVRIERVTSDYGGDFLMDSIFGDNYYLKVIASGYLIKYQTVVIPFGEDTVFDVGNVTLIAE